MTRTLWAGHLGPTQFVGIRFRAGGAVPFLRDRADLFTDDVVEADDVFGPAGSELKERLLAGCSVRERVRLLEQFLLRRLRADAPPVDSRIARASAKLIQTPGSQIEELAHELGISRQYVRRIFLQHTGLSPKAFARVARLRRLMEVLRAGVRLADAALASGYSDQAHMNHEFKDLVGLTPVAYRNRD
jgi:AraC-like DNA-binding protein